jgi:uncharacterized protein
MTPARRRLRNLTLFAVVALLLAVSGTLLYLCYTQALLLAYPVRAGGAQAADPGVNGQAVSFTNEDGLRLDGWYAPPDEDGAALVLVHGHAAERGQYRQEIAALTARGYGVLVFDLRNHGTSEGEVTSMGYYEIGDVRAAFDFLAAQPEVNPERIALYGHSMGAATAVRSMARIPQARALLITAGFADFADLARDGVRIRTGLPGTPFAEIIVWMTGRMAGADLFTLNPEEDIAQIAPRPVMIVHGDLDVVVPVTHGERLYAAAGEPKTLHIIPGAGHAYLLASDPDFFAGEVLPFLDEHLRGS